MSKSKKVTVSKQQLAETGEELEVVGALAEVAGMAEVAEGRPHWGGGSRGRFQ